MERKNYLDNIRWITVVLVVIYHIIYMYNCSGVITNMNVQGIPIFDAFDIFLYPWFMCLLFVISGMASKYSLEKRNNKEFLKDRAKRILVPSIVGIFLYGWICGLVTNYYNDMFAGAEIPGLIKYLIYCLTGTGPLWYCHVLFIASVLIVIIRKIDKKEKILELGKKVKLWMLIPLFFVVWGSSTVLNAPMITVYRFGIYLLMFFLGYYVFSNEIIQDKLSKHSIKLIILSVIIGIIYIFTYYGQNYTTDQVLQSWFTNLYLWIVIISLLTFGKKYMNFSNSFTKYMNNNNFSFYILHYEIVLLLGFVFAEYINVPFIFKYIFILIGTGILLPLISEIVKRIPIINKLVLGIQKS